MKIGIRAHDMGQMSLNELKESIIKNHFDGIQLVTNKALNQVYQTDEIKRILEDKILMLGAYFNMVHPDQKVVLSGIENFKKTIHIANQIGVEFVGTETGSLMGNPWGYVPENHLDNTYSESKKIILELLHEAKDNQVRLAIEGAYAHVIYSPKRMKQLLQEINHPKLKVTVDLYNFLNLENHLNHLEIFKECINLFSQDIVIFHLKDYVVIDQKLVQVGLGKGLIRYEEIIPIILKHNPDSYLIFEGVQGDDIKTSLTYIKDLINHFKKEDK